MNGTSRYSRTPLYASTKAFSSWPTRSPVGEQPRSWSRWLLYSRSSEESVFFLCDDESLLLVEVTWKLLFPHSSSLTPILRHSWRCPMLLGLDLGLGLRGHCLDCRTSEKIGCRMSDAAFSDSEIVFINLDSDAVPAPLRGGNCGRARAHEGIKNGVAHETEHADKTFSQFHRVRRRVFPR